MGGALANSGAEVRLVNTLVAHSAFGSNTHGTFIDLGHNISSDASFSFSSSSSRNDTDPLVGELAVHTGPNAVPTLPLLSGSPAIDSGNDAAAPSIDQRGVRRPYGVRSDIGAFEMTEPTFTIGGFVYDRTGIGGVEVRVGAAKALSDRRGYFEVRGVLAGTHEVRPANVGSGFDPESRQVTVGPSVAEANFRARAPQVVKPAFAVAAEEIPVQAMAAPFARLRVEASTNLVQWQSAGEVTADAGGRVYWKFVSTNAPQQFLRVVRP